MKKKKALYIIVAIIILAGIIVCSTIGFNFEEKYRDRKQIRIDNNTELDEVKIKEIAENVLIERNVTVSKAEYFGNSIIITSDNISEEEKIAIIDRVNEIYNSEIKADNVKVMSISHTRISDTLKKYILPGVLTLAAIALYSIIRYRKISVIKVLLYTIIIPIISEVFYYSLIAITRIPFGDITTAIALGVYVISITVLIFIFENRLSEIANKEENKKSK